MIKSIASPTIAAEFEFIAIHNMDARTLMDSGQLIERRTDLYKDTSNSGGAREGGSTDSP